MKVKKNGKRRGLQRFKCQKCKLQFQSKTHPSRRRNKLWNRYVWGKQTLKQLSATFKKCIPVIRKDLDSHILEKSKTIPQPLVLIADVTFFGRSYGVLVFRSQLLKRNIYYKEITRENPEIYRQAKIELENKGFVIKAIVLDGKRGVREVFPNIPTQMCQFHQTAILKRYLTSRPKTKAGQELRAIGLALTILIEQDFEIVLKEWHDKWKDFIKEKTITPDGKHWNYTHRRMRSAYRSLKTNAPFLFTYQKYPELKIPNTTNSLDGFFGKIKKLLRVHNGLTQERRYKIIQEILEK